MASVSDTGMVERLHRFSTLAAWASVLIGTAALLGWVVGIPALARVHASFATTKFNTALGLVLLGVGLLSIAHPDRSRTDTPGQVSSARRARAVARACGALAVLIASLTLAEYAVHANLGIDEVFARDRLTVPGAGPPGRMSLATALMVGLVGLALLLTDIRARARLYPALWLATVVGAFALIALMGYAYGVRSLYGVSMFGSVALPTACAFLLLAVGVACARPESGFMARVIADDPGGVLLRRLLPAAVLVPFAAGWFRLKGQDAGWYGTEFGIALFATLIVAVFSVLIGRMAAALARTDAVRRASEAELRIGQQRVLAILDASLDGVVTMDPDGRIVDVNRAAVSLFARTREQLEGRIVPEVLIPPSAQTAFRAWLGQQLARPADVKGGARIETDGLRADGVRIPLEVSVGLVPGSSVPLLALFCRDISERRHRDSASARLAAIIESSDDAIVSKTLDGTIVSWNPGAERLFGYSADEIVGRPMLLLFPADRLAEEADILAKLTSGETINHFETQRVRKDGSVIDVSVTTSPIRNAAGAVVGASKIARDIGDRRRADARVQTQLSRVNLLYNITRAIGERHDVHSIFQVVIRRVEEDLPVDFCAIALALPDAAALLVSAVGVRSRALALELGLPERTRIDVGQNGLARCLRGQLVYEPALRADQSPFAAQLLRCGLLASVFAPLLVESKVFGVLIAGRRAPNSFSSADCEFLRQLSEHVALAAHQGETYTALQQAYEELRRTQQTMMQQERLRVLGQLASGVAHDINNALSPASLYAEMLVDQNTDIGEESRERLKLIRSAIEDAARTVSRMKEFARLRDEAAVLAPVNLVDLVRHAVALTRSSWHDSQQRLGTVVALETVFEPGVPAVLGAESEIRDAVVNLILNSVDAMPQGGTLTLAASSIHTAGHASGAIGSVVLEVKDTGTGMSEEARRRCLEPFFSTKGKRGTGLGLAMVYGMMQRHGGELEIDSAPGRGTTVRLVFPPSPTREASVAEVVLRRPTRRLRLLVIDDDPLVLQTLREMLAGDGHQVTAADGGQAGIEAFAAALARGEAFDVVITDLGMPYVDGRRVAASIKVAAPGTPVILLTGWGQDADVRDDQSIMADTVLGKPPRLNVLRHAIAELSEPVNPPAAG